MHLLPDPHVELPVPRYTLITEQFTAWARRWPEQAALCQGARTWTYGQLSGRARAIARHLRAQGVRRGDVVAVYGPRCLGLVASMLGVFFSGGVLLTLDPRLPDERRRLMQREAGARHLLCVAPEPPPAEGLATTLIDPHGGRPLRSSAPETTELPVPDYDDPAYVFFTSGTTGVPKGILGSHKGLAHFVTWQRTEFGLGPHDRCAQLTALSFDVVLRDVFTPLASGATLCLPPAKDDAFDPARILPWLEREHITALHTVPAIAQAWLAGAPPGVALPRLRLAFFAGEPLPGALVRRWRAALAPDCEIVNLYGPTETTLAKCFYRVPDDPPPGVQPLGRPLPETQALILAGGDRLCGPGEAGEIALRTPFRSLGYVNAPEEARRRFVPNPFRDDAEDLFYYTGDRGRYRPDGALEILGRLDDQVKIRGVRVEPQEIEALLARHPAVQEALVLAQDGATGAGEKQLLAYVIPDRARPLPAGELRRFLSAKLPVYMIPAAFVALETWPLTANGKVDRRALPVPEPDQIARESAYVAPGNPLEETLAEIWAGVLGRATIGVHDDFFALGGHSLLATQVISRVRDHLQLDLPVRALFEAPTVAQMAAQLEQAHGVQEPAQAIGPRPEEAPVPLSFAQGRLWFLSQWEPDSPAYNIPHAFRLAGQLDITALRSALNAIVERHQVLRMVCTTVGEEPIQVPHPEPSLALETVDLGALPPGARRAEAERLTAAQARQPFDLAHDLPLRASLLRLAGQEHLLLLTIHHIATDGWSTGLLIEELATLYTAFCSGRPPRRAGSERSPLPPLPLQYADYAHWQRNWLQGAVLDAQLAYWRDHLAGAPSVTTLPADRPRPPVQTFHGAQFHFRLSPSLTQALKALSLREGVTPFMTLLAAFQTLLYRYTGQEDLVLGAPIAGRTRSEIEGLIGFFVNTLALRTQLSGDLRLVDLLQRVREITLEAYAHQDLPFEKLVEELQPERDLSHNPIFQVMFNYHNPLPATRELPHLRLEHSEVHNGSTKFDLNLALEERALQGNGDEIRGTLTYSTDLFEADTIRRLVDHFQVLLSGIVADPQARLLELPLLTPGERHQLLVEWCDTQATYPPLQCVHQLFEAQAAHTPDAPAVIFEGDQYTYRKLNQRANQVAHHLQSLGVGPDVPVGLFMERSLDILVGLLGILKAGGAYIPLDPIYPQERVRRMLEDAAQAGPGAAPVLVTQTHLAAELPDLTCPGGECQGDGVQVLCLDGEWPVIAQRPTTNPPLRVGPSNLIYVLFTSGSTGRPKGVAVEHRNYLNYYHGVMPRLKLAPGMHFAMVSTFSTDLGTIQFWAALTTGGAVHILPYERATDPAAMVDYFNRHAIDVLKLVPSHFDALQGAPGADAIVPRHLVIFTGEASQWETVARVKALNPTCLVQDHYGVTETTCATLTYLVPDEVPSEHAATLPLGRPLGNVRVHVLDPRMEPTPIGVPGELYIGGAGVTRGYVGRPALTAARFVPDPFAPLPPTEEATRLYRTGDLATYRPDGSLKLLGRIDHQVKIRGYRVESGEIETLLCAHPAVRDAVVEAREDQQGDRRLVAYVVPHPAQQGELEIAPLRDSLREQLPDYMVPTAFVSLEAIPLNPNGKVDRLALPAPAYTRQDSAGAFVAPRNALEAQIAASWREVLGIDAISIDDNFFDLGGESFKAIRAVRKIGESVNVMDLFRYPTIRGLAAHLAQGQATSGDLLYKLTPPGEKTLSLLCVPYGGGSAITYQPLANVLPENCALFAVELPGHNYAYRDQALQPFPEIARQCVEEIQRKVSGPIALYGHCVGAALAIEIGRLLEGAGVEIVGVFLGGMFPEPRLPGKLFEWLARVFPSDRWQSNLALYESLRALGGFTDVINPEEREFVLNNLRYDARQAEDYFTLAYATRAGEKLSAPILCIVGEMDRATEFYEERFVEWEAFGDSVQLAVIPQAGHYFLKHNAVELAHIIDAQLAEWQSGTAETTNLQTANAPDARSRKVGRAYRSDRNHTSLRVFFLVALSQFVSLIGTGLTAFALSVWVYQKMGSVTDLAFIWVFTLLPGILLLPMAGTLTDRWNRRRIMILSDVTAAGATLFVALLFWTETLQLWHIYLAVSVGSIANAFQQPAYVATIAQLVPKPYLGRVNGFVQLGDAVGGLLAPLLGGALVVTIRLHGVILIDFATFLFAIAILLLVRFPDTLFKKREEPFLKELVGGWRYITQRRGLVRMVAFFMVFNLLEGIATVLVTPLVLSFESATVLGTMTSVQGAGLLLGSLLMSLWGGTRRRAEGMVGFVTLYGLSTLVIGLRPVPLYPAIGLFGVGFSLALINAHWQTLIQTKVGLELQGRVFATNRMLANGMLPIGFVLAGPLASRVFEPLLAHDGLLAGSLGRLIGAGPGRGMGLMVLLAGALLAGLAVLGYRHRPLRFMEDELPDAIPGPVIIADKDALQAQADRQLKAQVARG